MSALRIIEGKEPEKWVDPRPKLIDLFNKQYESRVGRKNPLHFGACMKMMQKAFEIPDEHSGELYIEYPDETSWLEQVNGFFIDEWARDKRAFHFSYLMKQYGSFTKIKTEAKQEKIMGTYGEYRRCSDCNKQYWSRQGHYCEGRK